MNKSVIILSGILAVLILLTSCPGPVDSGTTIPADWQYGAEYLGSGRGTRFVLHAPGASTVYVSGTFNSWDKTPMNRDGDNFWV